MKIGEALEYRCLTDLGGKVVIDQGMAAWSNYVLSQRAILVVVATEQAIVLCKAMGCAGYLNHLSRKGKF
jgi:hypothetical protein